MDKWEEEMGCHEMKPERKSEIKIALLSFVILIFFSLSVHPCILMLGNCTYIIIKRACKKSSFKTLM